MNNIPKKILVLIIANMSNPLESLIANIWVIVKVIIINAPNNSKENNPVADEITKNQKENPAVIAKLLNLGDDNSILYWIDKCYKTTLC